MKLSRRSFLKSVAAVAAVTAAGIALPSVNAVEAMIEPEVHAKIYPAAVAPDHPYEDYLRREMLRVKKEYEDAILRPDRTWETTFTWTPRPIIHPLSAEDGYWKPTPFPHPFRETAEYTLATGRVVGWVLE